ncbi:MAG: histidine phosphatase family protein [Lachnospiraceae bacterium]|nr:histidine phosphatase family protein [Lachnospiraceae bacterium]
MIYIVRHGQTAKNKANILQGRSDIPLNGTGIRQAEETGRKFADAGVILQKVWSSPLLRARQTAEAIAPGVPCFTDGRLIEMDYGPYEGMDLNDPAPEVLTFFRDFVHNPAPEGMEPLSDVVRRAGEFLEEIRQEAASVDLLISTHAIAMKGILEYLTPDAHGKYWSKYIGNCEVYAAEVNGDGTFSVPYQVFGCGTAGGSLREMKTNG